MIQSDCNLVPNILKPIENEHRSAKNQNKISGGGGGGGANKRWNDTPLVLSTLSCLRHSMVSSVGPLWYTRRRPWVWANPQGASVCNVFLFFCHFPIRCSGSGVILIVLIPDICLLAYFLYSHEYRPTRNTVYCSILSDQIVVGCPLCPGHTFMDWTPD